MDPAYPAPPGFATILDMETRAPLEQTPAPGLLRRLAAILYDALGLFGVLVVASALVVLPAGLLLNTRIPPDNLGFRLYLLAVLVGYFTWSWVKGGQTLGMRIWRLRVLRMDGTGLRVPDALLRLLAALLSWAVLGLGFLWVWVDPQGLAWHDRLSATRLFRVENPRANAP